MLSPITSRHEVSSLHKVIEESWLRRAIPLERYVGWRGGGSQLTVHWREDLGLWAHMDANHSENRYWCCYGTEDPTIADNLNIAVEINYPHEGSDLRIAGVLLRSDEEGVFLAHTGKVGGGRRGVGRRAFLDYMSGSLQFASWPGRRDPIELVMIGAVRGPSLPHSITAFVSSVAEFKNHVARAGEDVAARPRTQAGWLSTPEFEGKKQRYWRAGSIEATCRHGQVVNQMIRHLRGAGHDVGRDRFRDVFVCDTRGVIKRLFEIKTSCDLTSLYTGVGQLLLHSRGVSRSPELILVLPSRPAYEIEAALTDLGISILTYSWDSGRPEIEWEG